MIRFQYFHSFISIVEVLLPHEMMEKNRKYVSCPLRDVSLSSIVSIFWQPPIMYFLREIEVFSYLEKWIARNLDDEGFSVMKRLFNHIKNK